MANSFQKCLLNLDVLFNHFKKEDYYNIINIKHKFIPKIKQFNLINHIGNYQ